MTQIVKKYNIMAMELRSIDNPLNECAWAQSRHALLRGFFVFAIIAGYDFNYYISPCGTVSKIVNGRHKKMFCKKDKNGYWYVRLMKDGIYKYKSIHRLVAEVFIGVPDRMVVNHIDGNIENNNVQNLEVVSVRENRNHGIMLSGKQVGVRKTRSGKYSAQVRLKCGLVHIGTFETLEEAKSAYINRLPENESRYAK